MGGHRHAMRFIEVALIALDVGAGAGEGVVRTLRVETVAAAGLRAGIGGGGNQGSGKADGDHQRDDVRFHGKLSGEISGATDAGGGPPDRDMPLKSIALLARPASHRRETTAKRLRRRFIRAAAAQGACVHAASPRSRAPPRRATGRSRLRTDRSRGRPTQRSGLRTQQPPP